MGYICLSYDNFFRIPPSYQKQNKFSDLHQSLFAEARQNAMRWRGFKYKYDSRKPAGRTAKFKKNNRVWV